MLQNFTKTGFRILPKQEVSSILAKIDEVKELNKDYLGSDFDESAGLREENRKSLETIENSFLIKCLKKNDTKPKNAYL